MHNKKGWNGKKEWAVNKKILNRTNGKTAKQRHAIPFKEAYKQWFSLKINKLNTISHSLSMYVLFPAVMNEMNKLLLDYLQLSILVLNLLNIFFPFQLDPRTHCGWKWSFIHLSRNTWGRSWPGMGSLLNT